MNNKKHVGSLAISSEPRNMRICFMCILALFRQISETNFTENICKYQITFQITSSVIFGEHTSL